MSLKSTPQITKRQVDSAELSDLIRAAINEGHTTSIIAPGGSMLPFIRSDDKIFIQKITNGGILVYNEDDAEVKRVELHAHTMMSTMDSVVGLDLEKHTWLNSVTT